MRPATPRKAGQLRNVLSMEKSTLDEIRLVFVPPPAHGYGVTAIVAVARLWLAQEGGALAAQTYSKLNDRICFDDRRNRSHAFLSPCFGRLQAGTLA